MTRPLPWKRDLSRETSVRGTLCPGSRPLPPELQQHAPPKPPRSSNRSLSSSPPPPPPAARSPMRDSGVDDVWMMVEDEFLSTAQSFTRQLHHAEYKRLIREACAKPKINVGEVGVKAYSRSLASTSQHRNRVEKKIATISAEMDLDDRVERGDDWSSDQDREEDILIPDRNLAGLMFGKSNAKACGKTNISTLVGPSRVRTRAAAGLGKSDSPQKNRQIWRKENTRLTSGSSSAKKELPNASHHKGNLVDLATESSDRLLHSRRSPSSPTNQARDQSRLQTKSFLSKDDPRAASFDSNTIASDTSTSQVKDPRHNDSGNLQSKDLGVVDPMTKSKISRRPRQRLKVSEEKSGGVEEIPIFLG